MTTNAGDAIRLLEKMVANSYQWPKERRNVQSVSYATDSGVLAAEIHLMKQEFGQDLKAYT